MKIRILKRRLPGLVRLIPLIVSLASTACFWEGTVYTDLRIYESPYAQVNWNSDLRLKAQHHDHLGGRPARILAYDAAEYNVLSLMDYSGNAGLAYAYQERMWPPEQWVPAWVISSLENIQFFIPNAEEVGQRQHATSPFLTTYIEGGTRPSGFIKQSWQYDSLDEMFGLIRRLGGFPCIAHPWDFRYDKIDGVFCVEIYSAFAEAKKRANAQGFVTPDRNESLLANWDLALNRNQRIFGIAVNDHFGPYATPDAAPDDVRDSGKIVVMTSEASPEAYRTALERGAFFAVRDQGVVKNQYPHVSSITVGETTAVIETTSAVKWVADGATVSDDLVLLYTDLTPNSRYIRAEVTGLDGSTVYTQAFVVRPIGDADGDYDIDARDTEICEAVMTGEETDSLRILACDAENNDPS